ncbi:MAG TPA: ABC transporter ATP-binding protein [Opitutaceae bacterium]|nr:ABC transporter ATP-binding protein [Opitutaceae bacterium]
MPEPIIQVQNVTKAYRIWASPSARLRSPLLEGAARLLPGAISRKLHAAAAAGYRDFHALREVAFSIRPGEATGIIGRNGSGKSTLLQLIAGTLAPTSGSLRVEGRVSALLELGSGFNPDFTGRENVYLNGALFGLTKTEMDGKFAEIAAFADIGDFIEEPVKTYSSGMMMRLAFAVAVTVQPDILIIDEALSVGDVFFTQKCFQRIREIVHRGATLIFVSHDMGAVQNLCDRALLLHEGRLAFDGAPEDCVSRYFNLHQPRAGSAARIEGARPAIDPGQRSAVQAADILAGAKSRHGGRSLEFAAAAVFDGHGAATWDFELMHRASVRVLVRANREVRLPAVGLQLHDRMGNLVYAAGTPQLRFPLPSLAAGEEVLLDFRLTLSLQPGLYTLSLDAAEYDENDPNLGNFFDRVGGLGPLTVSNHAPGALPFYGVAQLPMEISYG